VNISTPAPAAPERLDEATYRFIFDCNPHAMWLFDEDTLDFLDVNQAAIDAYGYSREEFLAMKVTQIRPPDEVARLIELMRSPEPRPPQLWTHLTRDGRRVDVQVKTTRATLNGRALRLASIRDLADQGVLEEQLRRDKRIETVGQLAASVAHDFNNLLTAIIGHADLLSEYFVPGDPRAAEVDGIRSAADVATLLTRQLLAFSRNQSLEAKVVDLNDVVERSRWFLVRLIGDRVQLAMDLSTSIMSVKVDRYQIVQTLMNLAINSREAMPDGGRLNSRTRNVSVSAADARRLSVEPGDYVVLSVADTGIGIDDRTRMHLFEPFFTTKEDRARGAGMGLATVYGIVKQSGGHIAVESELGVGTTFSIFLPLSRDAEVSEARPPSGTRAVNGERTVLLVEDDIAVRALVGRVLQRRGYHVIAADGCTEALSLATRHTDPIDAIITDIEVPGTSGIALTGRLREVLGPVPVLFMTGYADESAMPSGVISNSAFLRKPFTPDALARKVRTVLEPVH